MAKNCKGCQPCSKPIPNKPKACKPFTICVGNYSLIWDGSCPSIVERQYQIPNGTYTSITFTDGCITDVGQAPLPQYTPQGCCDGDANKPKTGGTQGSLTASKELGNLASILNGAITVAPQWDTTGNITVTGYGTADRPWKPSIKISKEPGNTLVERKDGLFANLFFETTQTVTVTGKGTKADPYKLDVQGAEAKLKQLNKTSIEGNGFTIDEQGRWTADEDLKVVTNLKFDHSAFSVVDRGADTLVVVDETVLKTGSELKTSDGVTGKGTTTDPIKVVFDEVTVGKILDVVQNSNTLKQRLRTILGV